MTPLRALLGAVVSGAILAAASGPALADEEATATSATEEGGDRTGDRQTALMSRVVLKVANPEETRKRLVEAAAAAGGFPVLVTDDSLKIKIPPGELTGMLSKTAAEGSVVEKTLERHDLTQTIADLLGRLRSKREILSRLRGFFDDSNAQATLRIEQTMTDLVAEIEQVEGALRVARDRARWAVVDISFEFAKRDRIVYVHSPFEWLNTVSLGRFLEEF